MTGVLRVFYLGGIVLALVSEGFFPTWVGRLYAPDLMQTPTFWREAGVFGLRGADSFSQRTMLGVPPQAYDPDSSATIRWPWEKPSQREHFELEFSIMFSRFSWVVLVLGYVVGMVHLLAVRKQPDFVVSVAWSISISLSVTWLAIYGLAIVTQGGATSGVLLIAELAVGMLIGLAFGLVLGGRRRTSHAGEPVPTIALPATGPP